MPDDMANHNTQLSTDSEQHSTPPPAADRVVGVRDAIGPDPTSDLMPVVLFVLGCLVVDVILPQVFADSLSVVPIAIGTGCLLGQAGFAIVLAGLLSRTWLVGYCWGVGLIVLGYLMLYISTSSIASGRTSPTMFAGLAMLPLFVAFGAIPFWACRWLRGWCLSQTQPGRTYRTAPVGMPQLFLATTLIASALILSRHAFFQIAASLNVNSTANAVEDVANARWLTLLLSQAIFTAIVSPFLLLSVWISFSSQAERRIPLQFGLGAFTLALMVLVSFATGAFIGGDGFVAILLGNFFTYAVLFGGYATLRAANFHLVSHSDSKHLQLKQDNGHFPQQPNSLRGEPADPFADGPPASSAAGEIVDMATTTDTTTSVPLTSDTVTSDTLTSAHSDVVWLRPSLSVEWQLAGLLLLLATVTTFL